VKGTGFGLYHAVLGITLLPASLIAGLLYDHVNSNAPFYFGSLMALIASLLMVIFVIVDRKNKSEIHTVHRIYKAPGKR
jgi:predicted MFS family arabinose efflux permease